MKNRVGWLAVLTMIMIEGFLLLLGLAGRSWQMLNIVKQVEIIIATIIFFYFGFTKNLGNKFRIYFILTALIQVVYLIILYDREYRYINDIDEMGIDSVITFIRYLSGLLLYGSLFNAIDFEYSDTTWFRVLAAIPGIIFYSNVFLWGSSIGLLTVTLIALIIVGGIIYIVFMTWLASGFAAAGAEDAELIRQGKPPKYGPPPFGPDSPLKKK